MATAMRDIRIVSNLIKLLKSSSLLTDRIVVPVVCPVRHSVYSKNYVEPLLDKNQLRKPLEETDERRYKPVKAAQTHESTSVAYDPLVAKFTNIMMKGGNKLISRTIMDKTLENIKRIQLEKYHNAVEQEKASIELNPVVVFHQAVENCKPLLKLVKIPKGGVMYSVPIACKEEEQRFRSMKWLLISCRDVKKDTPMHKKLAWEFLEAAKNEGRSVRKKQELHRNCEANRAYAHYRW